MIEFLLRICLKIETMSNSVKIQFWKYFQIFGNNNQSILGVIINIVLHVAMTHSIVTFDHFDLVIGSDRSPRRGNVVRACVCPFPQIMSSSSNLKSPGRFQVEETSKQANKQVSKQTGKQASKQASK